MGDSLGNPRCDDALLSLFGPQELVERYIVAEILADESPDETSPLPKVEVLALPQHLWRFRYTHKPYIGARHVGA